MLQILLRSNYIHHAYGLIERGICGHLSLAQHHLFKPALLVLTLGNLERTIATSVPKVDFLFYCLYAPGHVLPTPEA